MLTRTGPIATSNLLLPYSQGGSHIAGVVEKVLYNALCWLFIDKEH